MGINAVKFAVSFNEEIIYFEESLRDVRYSLLRRQGI
jgi:hypothetical protein